MNDRNEQNLENVIGLNHTCINSQHIVLLLAAATLHHSGSFKTGFYVKVFLYIMSDMEILDSL